MGRTKSCLPSAIVGGAILPGFHPGENYLLKPIDDARFASCIVRIHRSTIVQVERIVRVDPNANRDAVLTLRDGNTLRVSRTYRLR